MEMNTPEPRGISRWVNKHMLWMIVCCVAPILIILLVSALGVRNSFLSYAVALICPLSMVLMMVFMFKKGGSGHVH